MKRFILCSLAAFLLTTSIALADTIHLKNGSVIKGKVASFGDDQFVVMLETGSGRYMSKAMIYIGDVARIEFDSAPAAVGESSSAREADAVAVGIQPSDGASSEATQRKTQLPETQPRETAVVDPSPPPSSIKEQTRDAARERDSANSEGRSSTAPPQLAPEVAETPAPRKLTGPVKTVNVDVAAKRDWTSSGLIVKRGDRIRITAVGAVVLDSGSGQTSGPEGIELADTRKLMTDRPTGALIGVIGADNDDFIFVGRSAEFTAARDGLLFLSVNEGALADNQGTYKATIEVQSQSGRKQ